ncbi:MAG: DUF433 domain-containing protein [Chloroflexi bacterium]|nr:DUF433 domain-containing protein [Chloroflexota bacterium]
MQQCTKYIVRNPEILGGEPIIRGTRVPVWAVVRTFHYTPDLDYLCEAYPHVARAALEDALAFYESHREELDRLIAENEADDED